VTEQNWDKSTEPRLNPVTVSLSLLVQITLDVDYLKCWFGSSR